jgi:hypothetical protein
VVDVAAAVVVDDVKYRYGARMNLVRLANLNRLRFRNNPVPEAKLWRWCRNGELPAKKIGGEWYVDLDAFDRKDDEKPTISPQAQAVLDKLRAQERH